MALPNMTPDEMVTAAQIVAARMPGAELVKNRVGNLAIEQDGEAVGWIDLRSGEVHWFEGEQ